jgi:hypothetical protein
LATAAVLTSATNGTPASTRTRVWPAASPRPESQGEVVQALLEFESA